MYFDCASPSLNHFHLLTHPTLPSLLKTNTKIKTSKSTVRQNKNHAQMKQNETKIPLNSFYVGQLLLGMGHPWSTLDIPSDTPEKTDFPFARGYQLQIVSRGGLGPRVHLLLSALATVQMWYVLPQSLGLHGCISPRESRTHGSLKTIHHFWLLQSLLFHTDS